jgi:hypothetical protein
MGTGSIPFHKFLNRFYDGETLQSLMKCCSSARLRGKSGERKKEKGRGQVERGMNGSSGDTYRINKECATKRRVIGDTAEGTGKADE